MKETLANFRQSDIDRLILAAKKAGVHEVKVTVGINSVTIPLKEPKPVPERRPKRGQLRQPTVYFVGCDDHVKIGVTRGDVRQRMMELSTGQHRELVLLAKIENAKDDLEWELHKRFAAHRTRGEWFKLTPEIQSFIEGLDTRKSE
jgi:hypothetical protein